MKLRKTIPSSLTVGGERVEFYYKDQPRTCWTCGRGHIKAECKVKDPEDYINRFDIREFPELGSTIKRTKSACEVEEAQKTSEKSVEVLGIMAVAESEEQNLVVEKGGSGEEKDVNQETTPVDIVQEKEKDGKNEDKAGNGNHQVEIHNEETITASEGEADGITPAQVSKGIKQTSDIDDEDMFEAGTNVSIEETAAEMDLELIGPLEKETGTQEAKAQEEKVQEVKDKSEKINEEKT